MGHYHRQLMLSAPAADVYRAVATQQGVRSWWNDACEVADHVGGLASFSFGQTRKVMRIDRLEPGREVRWHCVESHIDAAGIAPGEWLGTDIVFQLTPRGETQTVLDFEHIGLTPDLGCWGICNAGWDQFMVSLRSLVETGQGAPFMASANASCQGAATLAASASAAA
jgi:uncharacterized protein YndB with AHSA1/START domain